MDIVKYIPKNRLMVETDAPFLIPKNIQPPVYRQDNQPAYLGWVVKAIASAIGRPEHEVAYASTQNAKSFFQLE